MTMSPHQQQDAGDVVLNPSNKWISHHDPSESSSSTCISSSPLHYSSPSDEDTISRLIDMEPHHMPYPDYLHRCRNRSVNVTVRQDSINWILKVHAYYHFGPVTALLSVNYFDRFLSIHTLPQANGWPFQLLSVACLSLAAKMEESRVPLLLNLQILDPKFVFDPKTVRRMELMVMSKLNWRLRSVTPFDYLHYFISKLPSVYTSTPDSFSRIVNGSSDLIIRTTRVIDFLDFAPSIVAAAAVLTAAGKDSEIPTTVNFDGLLNRDTVRSCHQLMEEYIVETCPSSTFDAPVITVEPRVQPPSPVGVLDAASCASCDTLSSSRPELPPPLKRLRSSISDVQQS